MSIDTPPDSPIPWARLETVTGCNRETYYSRLADSLLVAGARLVAGYMASKRREVKARRLAYSEGAVIPTPKMTRAEEIKRDAMALGTWRTA